MAEFTTAIYSHSSDLIISLCNNHCPLQKKVLEPKLASAVIVHISIVIQKKKKDDDHLAKQVASLPMTYPIMDFCLGFYITRCGFPSV